MPQKPDFNKVLKLKGIIKNKKDIHWGFTDLIKKFAPPEISNWRIIVEPNNHQAGIPQHKQDWARIHIPSLFTLDKKKTPEPRIHIQYSKLLVHPEVPFALKLKSMIHEVTHLFDKNLYKNLDYVKEDPSFFTTRKRQWYQSGEIKNADYKIRNIMQHPESFAKKHDEITQTVFKSLDPKWKYHRFEKTAFEDEWLDQNKELLKKEFVEGEYDKFAPDFQKSIIKLQNLIQKNEIMEKIAEKPKKSFLNTPQYHKFSLLPKNWENTFGLNTEAEVINYFKYLVKKHGSPNIQDHKLEIVPSKRSKYQFAAVGVNMFPENEEELKTLRFHFSTNPKGGVTDPNIPKIIKQINLLHELTHSYSINHEGITKEEGHGFFRTEGKAFIATEGHSPGFAKKFNELVEKEFNIKNWNFPDMTTKKELQLGIKNHYLLNLFFKKYSYQNIYEPEHILKKYEKDISQAESNFEGWNNPNLKKSKVRSGQKSNIEWLKEIQENAELKEDLSKFQPQHLKNSLIDKIKKIKTIIYKFKKIDLTKFRK